MFYVYILQCADKTYYVGSTNDLEKRLHSHNHLKSGAHYTKIRRPVKLVYKEKFKTYSEVRAREGELKQLERSQKNELIGRVKKVRRVDLRRTKKNEHSLHPKKKWSRQTASYHDIYNR